MRGSQVSPLYPCAMTQMSMRRGYRTASHRVPMICENLVLLIILERVHVPSNGHFPGPSRSLELYNPVMQYRGQRQACGSGQSVGLATVQDQGVRLTSSVIPAANVNNGWGYAGKGKLNWLNIILDSLRLGLTCLP